jgi:hypothetical protein
MIYRVNDYLEILKKELREMDQFSYSTENYKEGYKDGLETAIELIEQTKILR